MRPTSNTFVTEFQVSQSLRLEQKTKMDIVGQELRIDFIGEVVAIPLVPRSQSILILLLADLRYSRLMVRPIRKFSYSRTRSQVLAKGP